MKNTLTEILCFPVRQNMVNAMEHFYLIDFENVVGEGLSGCDKLNSHDHIIIFFTKNARKLDMSDIANHGEAGLEMMEIPAGRQSADIHIASYLGYLAGIHKSAGCQIDIVSNDTDFDNVIKFWNAKSGIKSARLAAIKAAKAPPSEKAKAEGEASKPVNLSGFEPEIADYITSLLAKNTAASNRKQGIYRAIIAKFGQAKGLNIYNQIKKQI